MAEHEREWRIGELARATGVTVRALRHYDRLGLLTPSSRTYGGHRSYTGDDVRRLHRILALRGFGFSLREITDLLDRPAGDPRDLVRRQLHAAEERVRAALRLRLRLLGVLGALDRMTEPSTDEFIELIEVMTKMDRRLTPEEFRRMADERRETAARLTPEELAEMSRVREEARRGLTPEDLAEMERRRRETMPLIAGSGGDSDK